MVVLTVKRPVVLTCPFVAEGVVPSVVYLRVAPSGMVTRAMNELVNSCEALFMIGASNRAVANTLQSLLFPGVGSAVSPQLFAPSVVRAYDVREMAAG